MPRNSSSAVSNGAAVVPPIQDPSQTPGNLYYLHPIENSATPLVTPLLTAKNYHGWVRLMTKALINKNKIRFIDGSLPKPDRFDPTFDAWVRCNNQVHTYGL